MFTQKCAGVAALLVATLEMAMCYAGKIDEDGAFLLLIPVGIWFLLARKKVIY